MNPRSKISEMRKIFFFALTNSEEVEGAIVSNSVSGVLSFDGQGGENNKRRGIPPQQAN